MDVILIFDVSDRTADVRAALLSYGYYPGWFKQPNTPVYNLPHNTVWRNNITFELALIDLRRAIAHVNSNLQPANFVTLQRYITTTVNPWDGITGVPV